MNLLEVNVLVLAYMGDTIYENYVRRYLINKGIGNVNDLQTESLKYVSARSQAKYLQEMIDKNFLSEFELDREKKNLTIAMDNCMKNIRPYHGFKIKELIDDQGILSRDLINHRDLIDKVNPNNLYDYYQNHFMNMGYHNAEGFIKRIARTFIDSGK